jgi:hypothetical protein
MTAAKVSWVSNGLFVGLLLALHFVKSDLDPSWHFISEYAIGPYGWMMQLAFLALALANMATWWTIRTELSGVSGWIGSAMFLMGTLGVVLGAVFVTDPINSPLEVQTISGNLHNVGGALGLLGFVGTVILSWRLLRSETWRTVRLTVGIATTLLVLGFLVAFVSIATLAAKNNGVFSPDTPVGWPNRIGILAACLWLGIITTAAQRKTRPS